ncbi:carbohydrate-binding family 9-like protein [Costertonia aggregata]|uniref:Carbohydrate-binding family 9-like protein n=1 Tax=Costertonia aggregata TaxID=343403 RepID=A0A7H9AMW4_9FLAO|nr:carbohydrate-binding family 9-like protein [Costertonia aggregata]QLG44757.1 carbohydrate-binding family 9-like protein [Costertonia aggregata]
MSNISVSKNSFGLSFLLSIIGFYGAFSQNVPRAYVANKVDDSFVIDGKADELSWQKTDWSQPFIDIEGKKKPTYETKMKMLWDDENLYIFAIMEEPHVWATLKQRDTIIFYNNDFEIFIDPDGDTHNYYELEMNALNTIWDLYLSKPYRNGGTILGNWDFKGLESAVYVQGSLNDSSDTDTGWSVEIAIPWSFTTPPGGNTKIPENDFWRINFSRVNWDFDVIDDTYYRKKDKETGDFLHEYNWVWSPQGVVNMHEPEHWGYVFFSTEAPTGKAAFKIPEDEYIKWYLYDLYRDYSKTVLTKKKILKGETIFGEHISPKLETYKYGWILWVESPFTKKVLSVNNEGLFRSVVKE